MVDTKKDIEMRLTGLKADLRNKEQEQQLMAEAKEKQAALIEYGENTKRIKERMHAIAQEQFEMLTPFWKFQLDEEYNELRRELSDIEHEASMREFTTNIEKGAKNLKNYIEQYDSVTAGIEDLHQKIAALEGKLK